MKEVIEKNIIRIKHLADELGEIYSNGAEKIKMEKIEEIHSEIKTRTILDKIYTNRELSETNLIALNNYVKRMKTSEKEKYNKNELELLQEIYEKYKEKINQLLEIKNDSKKIKNTFVRKKTRK